MQKTYDECYLICSTAIYFEGQVSHKIELHIRDDILGEHADMG